MQTRSARVTLDAHDAPGVPVTGVLQDFTPVDRIKRAAMVMGIALGVAAAFIPIPIIHLLGIPLVLLAGLLTASRQLAAVVRLQPLRVPCPKCGAINRIGGSFGYRSVAAPIEHRCDSCRRNLVIRITPE